MINYLHAFIDRKRNIIEEIKNGMKVLVVDAGGRGNAIAHAFSRSEQVKEVYVAPGNGGSEFFEKCKIAKLKGGIKKGHIFLAFCRESDGLNPISWLLLTCYQMSF